MRTRMMMLFLTIAAITIVIAPALFAQDAPQPGWLERETLTGDWGGGRSWLQEHGITLKPRLTQFYQGLNAGDDDPGYEYGGKADLALYADLDKLGLWKGFSMIVHAEYNFGMTINGDAGALAPVNTALYFPGLEGEDVDDFDVSSVYFAQKFGDAVSLAFGKINIIDLNATKPFAGGAGIDSFWNVAFAAPPSGTVPPYLFGALLSVRTKPATFGFWVYDPNDVVNRSVFDDSFADGVTLRSTVDFPITIADRSGHQGLVATFSTMGGNERDTILGLSLPQWPDTINTKDDRYYFAYTFDQYLYQSKENPKESVGIVGQFGISDGNPNRLYWSGYVGIGGTGLIPTRSRDNWGAGYYYAAPSADLKDALESVLTIRDEQGVDVFYNFTVTPWFTLGADLQFINPGLADDSVMTSGLRAVLRF